MGEGAKDCALARSSKSFPNLLTSDPRGDKFGAKVGCCPCDPESMMEARHERVFLCPHEKQNQKHPNSP